MSDEYEAVLAELAAAFRDWIESDRQFIDSDLARATERACLLFDDGVPGPQYAEAARAIGDLRVAARKHDDRCDAENNVLLKPAAELLAALRAAVETSLRCRRRPRTQLEAVASLREQKVPDAQICQIYGWGSWKEGWDFRKIDDELKEPGCHSYKDPNWMPPHDRRRAQEDESDQASWEDTWKKLERKVRSWTRKPKETLKELIDQKVHLEQLCVLFRCDEDEILRRCKAEGLPEPPRLGVVQSERSMWDKPEPEEITRIFARSKESGAGSGEQATARPAGEAVAVEEESLEGLTEEQQIIRLHQGGHDAAAIAKSLKLGKRRVEAIVARFEENPEAFSAEE